MKGAIAGVIVFDISLLTMVASFIHLQAVSVSNAAMIKDIVVVLFTNDMDEQLYVILRITFPMWVEEIQNDITKETSNPYQSKKENPYQSKKEEFAKCCKKIENRIREVNQTFSDEVMSIKYEDPPEAIRFVSTTETPNLSRIQKAIEEKKSELTEAINERKKCRGSNKSKQIATHLKHRK